MTRQAHVAPDAQQKICADPDVDCKTFIILIYAILLVCRAAWLEIAGVVGKDVPQVPALHPVPWMVDFV